MQKLKRNGTSGQKKKRKKEGKGVYAKNSETDKKNILGFGHLACPEEEERWSENEREREKTEGKKNKQQICG